MKKERTIITQELCDHVKILLAGGATAQKAAEITKTGHATISRIKAAGFDAEVYRKKQAERTEKGKKTAEDQLKGQMQMDLQQEEEHKAEMSDQTKLMRFQAGQVDKLIMQMNFIRDKLEKLNDTMSMVLRAVRRE